MPMNAEQFRAALETLGLRQSGSEGADSFLGVGEATIRRWARGAGDNGVPDSVAMLLRIMVAHRWKPDGVRERYADSREGAES